MAAITEARPSIAKAAKDETRKQIRGSSLLLAGRLLSTLLNMGAQVLMVRYLTTTDYGAWAYAFSFAMFCQTFSTLGLHRATPRFIPIYHERKERNKLLGTLVLVLGTWLSISVVVIVAVYALPALFARFVHRPESMALLPIVIFLVPLDAMDLTMLSMFASFGRPSAIFFRKYVLTPGLKLLVVLLMCLLHSTVRFMAIGYVLSSLFGVLLYCWIMIRQLRDEGILTGVRWRDIIVPAREIFGFTVPVMTSDLVMIANQSVVPLLLGYFYDVSSVALYRVVVPAAVLNQLVMNAFTLMYMPSAARLMARNDTKGINDLYWRTALWLGVLSFPIFAMSFCFARPLTVFLYGHRYAESGKILAMLAVGQYFNVVLGFNGLTLKVLGKLRYIVTINVLAAVASVVMSIIFIPRYGPLGAGIVAASSLIVHNILKQGGLLLASGISLFDRRYSWFYVVISTSTVLLVTVQKLARPNIYLAGMLTAAATLAILRLCSRELKIAGTFPEVLRIPLVKRLIQA